MGAVALPVPLATVTLSSVPAVQPARDSVATPVETSDEVLFAQARTGNREALGALIGRYEKTLFALLVRMTQGNTHRAEDLFQETFLHAMRAAETFNQKAQFRPWVTAIAVNLVRDDARRRKVRGEVTLDGGSDAEDRPRSEPAADIDCPAVEAERRDEEEAIGRGLQRLTEVEREVVLLHFYNGMTLVETAEVLSVPVGTVKSRLHAALTRLSEILKRFKDR